MKEAIHAIGFATIMTAFFVSIITFTGIIFYGQVTFKDPRPLVVIAEFILMIFGIFYTSWALSPIFKEVTK